MPIYEYQCAACGHQLEAIQKISAAPLSECPACNKPELRKQVSAPAFRLNGSGWYETDFKTGQKKNLAGDNTANASTSPTNSNASTSSTTNNTSTPTSSVA